MVFHNGLALDQLNEPYHSLAPDEPVDFEDLRAENSSLNLN